MPKPRTTKGPKKKAPVAATETISSASIDRNRALRTEGIRAVASQGDADDPSGVFGVHEVWRPNTVEDVCAAVVLSEGRRRIVRSGAQAVAQDRTDGTGAIVFDLSGLSSMTDTGDGALRVGVGATNESLALALAARGVTLPLLDMPRRSVVSSVLDETPSMFARSIGTLADHVVAIDAVTDTGVAVHIRGRDGMSPVEEWRGAKPIVTDITFAPRAADDVRLYRVEFLYPGRETFHAIARAAFENGPPSAGANLVLDAYSGAYDVPLVRLTATTREASEVSTKALVEDVLAAVQTLPGTEPLVRFGVSGVVTGAEILQLHSPFVVPADSAIDSTRLGLVSAPVRAQIDTTRTGATLEGGGTPSAADVLGAFERMVDDALLIRPEVGKANPDLRIAARIQWNPSDAIDLGGYAYTRSRKTPLATLPHGVVAPVGRALDALPMLLATPLVRPSPIAGFRGHYVGKHHGDYEEGAKQYATTSFPVGTTAPFAITYPKDAPDIGRVLTYAKGLGKRVVARSGGHQYTGKSSGGDDTIVVDMRAFSEILPKGDTVRVGAGVRLTRLADELCERRMTIPHGECPEVAIGGHAQTGGFGHLLRSFGLTLDHVIALDIVLADGTRETLLRPPPGEGPNSDDEELFWGVLGGNAGSFAIVTHYTFKCILDDDYLGANAYTATVRYRPERFAELMQQVQLWSRKVAEGTLPEGLDFMMTVESEGNVPFPVMLVEVVDAGFGGLAERAENAALVRPIRDATEQETALWERLLTRSGQRRLSELSDSFVRRWPKTTWDGREFRTPYKKRVNSTSKPLTDAFVSAFVQLIDTAAVKTPGVKLVFQMLLGGGRFRASRAVAATSIPRRDYVYCFVYDLFYDEGHEAAADALQKKVQALVDRHFSHGQEQRAFWGTFGDTDMTNPVVRAMYYDDAGLYQRLQRLKKRVDPDDLFHTTLTVKLPAAEGTVVPETSAVERVEVSSERRGLNADVRPRSELPAFETGEQIMTTLTADPQTLKTAKALKDDFFAQMFGVSPLSAASPSAPMDVLPLGGNILGVGYGSKVTNGAISANEAIRVYVRQKLPKSQMSISELIPPAVAGGVPTDVIAVGDVSALAHMWPTPCGVSVGHFAITAGTIGCRVAMPGETKEYILSNNHVLADVNAAMIGDDILQPGPYDGGVRGAPPMGDVIGRLAQFANISFTALNTIDAAIAEPDPTGSVTADIQAIGRVGAPTQQASLHASVRKHGRTTGHTLGVIQDVSAFIRVRFGTRVATFDNQIAITGVGGHAFSAGGDSGSLIVDAVTSRPVGLLFAGGGSQTFANPIDAVLAHFGVTIV